MSLKGGRRIESRDKESGWGGLSFDRFGDRGRGEFQVVGRLGMEKEVGKFTCVVIFLYIVRRSYHT